MPEKLYVYLFILCAISYHGIAGAFLEEDIGELSNVPIREKRVISRNLDEDVPVASGALPYVVNIKGNNRIVGVGSILSPRTVITAAECMILDTMDYVVTSASIYSYRGVVHNVTNKEIRLSLSHRNNVGIALVYVNPPFQHRYSGSIGLHSGPVLTGMHGTVIGWASSLYRGRQQTRYPKRLRAITVPIMNHRECVSIYRGIFEIREDHVCTYHEQKQCGHTDAGAPLVIDNELVGVHIGIVPTMTSLVIKPDIFILLQDSYYNQWIRSHIVD